MTAIKHAVTDRYLNNFVVKVNFARKKNTTPRVIITSVIKKIIIYTGLYKPEKALLIQLNTTNPNIIKNNKYSEPISNLCVLFLLHPITLKYTSICDIVYIMKEPKSTIDISIVITAHREGIVLHKTILSLLKSAKSLEEEDITYEFLVNLDNPDAATSEYIKRWETDDRFVISRVSFGNPADNRNDAIKKARGTYVALMDGDDLISMNWLLSSYRLIREQKEPTVLRPAVHAQFGYEDESVTAWFMRNSLSKEVDAIQMSYWNLWTNALFTERGILLDNPYKAPVKGFGHEDFLLNANMRAKGIAQVIVPETALWYRNRINSVSSGHVGAILDYSELFSIENIKKIPIANTDDISKTSIKQRAKSSAVRLYRFAYDTAKKVGPLNRAMAPAAREILYKKKSKKIPAWFIERWKEVNEIENQLWPTKGEIAKIKFHPLSLDSLHNSLGIIYQRLCHSIAGDKIDYLFLAPEMSGRGGTEKLISNYIRAIQKTHPSWKIAILSTQPYNKTTLDFFGTLGVDMLDFGSLMWGRSIYERDIIWSRILVHSKVKRLHLVNDAYWYHWLARHQKFIIENNYKIYISLFMREFAHEPGRIHSFADPDLLQVWPTVTKVFTDNKSVIDNALENNAFNKEKMVVHYQPQDVSELAPPKDIDTSRPVRILWASRISHQKRPDILKKIANKLGDDYVVDAYGIIEKRQYKQAYFDNSKVNYKGTFNGIGSIPTDKYDIYLYTSQTDGIPNILMEVAAAGLPIIASNIGGVSEFIKHNKTGLLVEMEDIDGYIKAIEQVAEDRTSSKSFVINSQDLIKTQHSWGNFINNVAKDLD